MGPQNKNIANFSVFSCKSNSRITRIVSLSSNAYLYPFLPNDHHAIAQNSYICPSLPNNHHAYQLSDLLSQLLRLSACFKNSSWSYNNYCFIWKTSIWNSTHLKKSSIIFILSCSNCYVCENKFFGANLDVSASIDKTFVKYLYLPKQLNILRNILHLQGRNHKN